ncbi:MAG TPA: prolyl oligopeptidase family serine peptidase, partial [Gaiellaceae bacterium]|nr:prolyl oligopeptidase family serine peptidase [Gaiellaceae bacterium]
MGDLRALLELRQAWPVAFAPDGESLLVASDLPGTRQLFRLPAWGGALEQLTDLDEPVDGLQLPDGRILLAVDEAGNERTQLHVLGEGPLVVDPRFIHRSPHVSRDGSLLAYVTNRRNGLDFDVVVRRLASGEERAFELGGLWASGEISPDRRWVAAERFGELSGDSDLFLLGVETGEIVHVTPHDGQAEYLPPVWLADSSGFLAATNEGRDTFAVARYDLAAARWEVLLESDWDLQCFGDGEGRHLLVEANEDGWSRLELRDPRTLELREEIPLPGRGVAEHFAFSPDGSRLAFGFSTTTEPHQVYVHELGSGATPRKLTDTGGVAEGVQPELHRVASFDGEQIPVFLFRPAGEGPFPVVVTVHGGPEAQWRPWYSSGFGALTQFLVGRGYAVAAPNVRGSTGYGKRFEHLDDVEKRLDSVADLAAVHGWLAARPEIDGARAVVYGRSYGGYMTLAALAFQPELWAAGIEFVGISNLRTFLENTSEWRRAAREREYGSLSDPELLERLSPWSRLEQIRAPLFIEHGRNDPRVPVSESEAIHAELVERGVR